MSAMVLLPGNIIDEVMRSGFPLQEVPEPLWACGGFAVKTVKRNVNSTIFHKYFNYNGKIEQFVGDSAENNTSTWIG